MNHIITLKADGGSVDALLSSCETTAKSVADNMPQNNKDDLASQFLAHYFFLRAARAFNPDVNSPQAEAAFEVLNSILDSAGISITTAAKITPSN